jgi:hypothetical protein
MTSLTVSKSSTRGGTKAPPPKRKELKVSGKDASVAKKPVVKKAAKRLAVSTPVKRADAVEVPQLREINQKQKIKVLAEGNPRREGTETFDHWKKFVKDGITVEDFLAKGGQWLHLRADIARGNVKLVG